MSQNAKGVFKLMGVLSTGTLFLEIWGVMFGFLRLSGLTAIAVAAVCMVLLMVAITALDPPKMKG